MDGVWQNLWINSLVKFHTSNTLPLWDTHSTSEVETFVTKKNAAWSLNLILCKIKVQHFRSVEDFLLIDFGGGSWSWYFLLLVTYCCDRGKSNHSLLFYLLDVFAWTRFWQQYACLLNNHIYWWILCHIDQIVEFF